MSLLLSCRAFRSFGMNGSVKGYFKIGHSFSQGVKLTFQASLEVSICKGTDALLFPHRRHRAHRIQTAASSRIQLPVQAHDFEGGRGDFLVHHKHEGGRQNCLEQLGLQAFIQTQNPVLPAKQW